MDDIDRYQEQLVSDAWRRQVEGAEARAERLKARAEKAEARVQELEAEVAAITRHLGGYPDSDPVSLAETVGAACREHEAILGREADRYEARVRELEAVRKAQLGTIGQQEKDIKFLRESWERAEKQIDALYKNLRGMELRAEAAEARVRELEAEWEDAHERLTSDLTERAEKAEARYEQVTREFDRVCAEREKAEAEADDWKQKWEAGRLLISDLEDRLESALEDVAAAEALEVE